MRFLNSQMLWLIPVVLVMLAVLFFAAAARRKKALGLLLGNSAGDPASVKLSGAKRGLRFWLLAGTLCCLVLAAARPFHSSELVAYKPQGRDVLILFDVSRSMLATDVAPSRLEHAKYLLRQLIARESSDRFGIVAFAGHCYLLCPLTADRVALEEYIRDLAPGIVPVGGTNLELALTTALAASKEGAAGSRGFVLITDGDELSGDAVKAAKALKEQEIPLFVVGLGDPGTAAPVPAEGGGFMRLANGELVTSRLNETKLRELAFVTDGLYIRSTATDTGLPLLERRIAQLGKSDSPEGGTRHIPVEEFPFFLAVGTILFFLYMILGERPFVRRAGLFLPLLLLLGAAESEPSLPVPQQTLPASPAGLYNYALEQQKEGKADFAPHYESVIRDAADNTDLRKRAFHNLGSAAQIRGDQSFEKARGELSQQQPDQALATLGEAEKEFGTAEELYIQSLALPGEAPSGENLRKMTVDLRELRELKKKIEELKKQQQQAQQQTQQAKQQNQQQQQNKEQQQQNQQQTQQAKQSAEELEKKADELNQKQLSDQAQKAKEELEKAEQQQRENRPLEAQKHLDKAAEELGREEKQPQPQQQQEQKENSGEEKQEQPQPQPQPGKEEKKEAADDATARQLLQMMQQEEQELRDDLNKDIRARERRVEKDW